jgi:hypothetical protein
MDGFRSVNSDETNRFFSTSNAHDHRVAIMHCCDSGENATTRIW